MKDNEILANCQWFLGSSDLIEYKKEILGQTVSTTWV